MAEPAEILTIGHSNHLIEAFTNLLQDHGVTAIADIRSVPFSRHLPQFNKDSLAAALKAKGIAYVFLGKELGGRTDDRSCYEKGRVSYRRVAETKTFRQGLERLRSGASTHRVALMCAEKEPLDCHRTLLVARALADAGVPVRHIHADGHLETQDQAMDRLIAMAKLSAEDLFRSRAESIELATARQEARIAYTDEKLAAEAGDGAQ
jgi:uncharacterized protein (DUF488 family)